MGLTRAELLELREYDRIAIYLWRKLISGHRKSALPAALYFTQDDVREAMHSAVRDKVISKAVANAPDIKYTYDARNDLPAEIEERGPRTWLQAGKGKYRFQSTKRKNLIALPDALTSEPKVQLIADQTPPFISALLGNDEQAVFTRVRNAGLIDSVLGFQAWPIQGHHRTTVHYGQIEVDEVQAGIDDDKGTIVPISGKGGQDKLSWSQALNLNTYGAEKAPMPSLEVKSLGLWRDNLNTVWIVEFTPEIEIDDIKISKARRFKFK